MHIVDVDVPSDIMSYVNIVLDKADRHNVQVQLLNTKHVTLCDGSTAWGYFDDTPTPALCVGCDYDVEHWFPVFLHESSHMDQWIENCEYWKNQYFAGVSAVAIINLWINKIVELSDDNKWELIKAVRELELDCEKRTARKIQENKFLSKTVDVQSYCQRGNSYVLFYNILGMFRKWYLHDHAPYNSTKLCSMMPTTFKENSWYEPTSMSTAIYDVLKEFV
jgi:hypothetical protein